VQIGPGFRQHGAGCAIARSSPGRTGS
jgi:hypothetical protein